MNTETDGDTTQLIADILFHICLNFIGWQDLNLNNLTLK